jgi:gamma-glutamylcyclotransferase (GGCT)/AIG2-like uncharacterized protein YtfP
MNLFTYGSLMYPEVWTRVMGRAHASRRATIAGYSRRRVPGQVYPALVVDPGSTVTGVLYAGLTEAEIDRLDRFEGEDYPRVSVQALTEDGAAASTFVYIYAHPERASQDLWDPSWFEREGLQRFLDSYAGWST